MGLRLPEELNDRTLVPLCLVKKFKEARMVEALLDSKSIDYTVETTPAPAQSVFSILFGSSRRGVLFLVPDDRYESSVTLLVDSGLSYLVVE